VNSKRIPSLDGLRAVSIATVVVGHVGRAHHFPAIWSAFGNTGVRIFFVISGYLITRILLGEHVRTGAIDLREFYIRRAYRIFPAAFVFLIVAVVVDWHQMTWYHVAAAFFYLANYDYSQPWIFGHLWSLSVEEQFYILWPSVLKRWYQHRHGILLGVIAFAPVLHAVLYRLKVPAGGDSLFPVIADNLATGCLLAMLAPRIPRISGYLALAMTAAIILVPYYPANTVPRTMLMLFLLRPLFQFSIAGVVLHVIQVPYRFLNWPPVEWLGRISYSLYLWQEPFCPNPNIRPVYAILLALVAASLSYYCVERPLLKFREKRRREPGATIPTATVGPTAQSPARNLF
jgi:peptidoglycan/LPS O-acetylase OafA/YrhL